MDIHFLSAHPADMSNSPKHRCANIKNKKHPMMRCTYPIKRIKEKFQNQVKQYCHLKDQEKFQNQKLALKI